MKDKYYPLKGDYSKDRERFVESITSSNKTVKGHFERAYEGRSLRSAITAKCLDCTCGQSVEVKYCTVVSCPLWVYRPYKKETQKKGN